MIVSASHTGRQYPPIRQKSGLSSSRRSLVELMQSINFGRIEGISVDCGEPLLNPAPVIVREIKFGGENGPRPETRSDDFVLKSEVLDLFEQFDRLLNCQIESLEIKHGLPFRMFIRESAV